MTNLLLAAKTCNTNGAKFILVYLQHTHWYYREHNSTTDFAILFYVDYADGPSATTNHQHHSQPSNEQVQNLQNKSPFTTESKWSSFSLWSEKKWLKCIKHKHRDTNKYQAPFTHCDTSRYRRLCQCFLWFSQRKH